MQRFTFLALLAAVACDPTAFQANDSRPTVTAASTQDILAGTLAAETHADATDRPFIDLNGDWQFRFDDDDAGLVGRWFAAEVTGPWDTIPVPGSWDLDHPQGYGRQTIAWYARSFTVGEEMALPHLRFEGMFRETRVWLNGAELGTFDLPYLPFGFDLSGKLKAGANRLVLRIDNRITRQSLPVDTLFNAGKHGWWPYGGLTRPVMIYERVAGFAATVTVAARANGSVVATLAFGAPATDVRVAIERDGFEILAWPARAAGADSALRYTARVAGASLWTPETPGNVYTLVVRFSNQGRAVTDRYLFAFKDFTAHKGRFWLNGRDRFLRGMNRHEDHPEAGPVYREDVIRADVALLKELHVDFIRPAHYPNDVRVLQALERAGIMIAEEIPVYQLDDEQLGDPVLVERAQRAMQIMILRDFNRPGMVMWSLANEIHNWVANAPAFLQAVRAAAKSIDPRPVMVAAATIPPLTTKDISSGVADVIGINEYWGWYVGKTGDAAEYLTTIHARFPERTFMIGEYGADALLGRHIDGAPGDESVADHSYSEEYQVYFHERHLAQFERIAFIRGVMPWVFADFRYQWTPSTGDHPVPQMNLKGLVDHQRRRKAAFSLIEKTYARYAAAK